MSSDRLNDFFTGFVLSLSHTDKHETARSSMREAQLSTAGTGVTFFTRVWTRYVVWGHGQEVLNSESIRKMIYS